MPPVKKEDFFGDNNHQYHHLQQEPPSSPTSDDGYRSSSLSPYPMKHARYFPWSYSQPAPIDDNEQSYWRVAEGGRGENMRSPGRLHHGVNCGCCPAADIQGFYAQVNFDQRDVYL